MFSISFVLWTTNQPLSRVSPPAPFAAIEIVTVPSWVPGCFRAAYYQLPRCLQSRDRAITTVDAFITLRTFLYGRAANAYTNSTAHATYQKALDTAQVRLLFNVFPDLANKADLVVSDMMYQQAVNHAAEAQSLCYGEHAAMNERLGKIGTHVQPAAYPWKTYVVGAVLVAAAVAMRHWSPFKFGAGSMLERLFDWQPRLVTPELVASNLLVAPLLEEAIKSVHPQAALVFGIVEGCSMGNPYNAALQIGLHVSFQRCGNYRQRVIAHFAHNLATMLGASTAGQLTVLALSSPSAAVLMGVTWLAVQSMMVIHSSSGHPNAHRFLCGTLLNPSVASHSIREWRITADDPTPCPDTPQPAFQCLPRYEPTPGLFSTLIETDEPFLVPAKTNTTVHAMLKHRVLKAPPVTPINQLMAWTVASPMLREFIEITIPPHPTIYRRELLEEWIRHFDARRQKRYRRAAADLAAYGPAELHKKLATIELMPKCNEALFKHRTFGADDDFKPRLLHNVAPVAQTYVGPSTLECSARLKKCWHWSRPFVFRGKRMTITYACGFNAVDVTHWLQDVTSSNIDHHVIVSGDDVLILVRVNGVWRVFEIDLKMCDQSMGLGPLIHEKFVLQQLGMAKKHTDALAKIETASLIAPQKEGETPLRTTLAYRPQRVTGAANTTIGNSTEVGTVSAVSATMDDPSVEQIYYQFRHFGFQVKVFETTLCQMTFLKGMWLESTAGPHWCPLPSRFLKLGKTCETLDQLYGKLARKSGLQECGDLHLARVSAGYKNFLLPPILAEFCAANYRSDVNPLRLEYGVLPSKLEDAHLLQGAVAQLAFRYGVPPSVLHDFSSKIRPGAFYRIDHPFARMAERDYH